MLPLFTPLAPLISDSLNIGADTPFPRFACVIIQLQIAILKNPQLLVYYVGVCQHNLHVTASSSSKALFSRITAFLRDMFPDIYVKPMPIGHYGFVRIVPAGTIPVINFSRELVVALETASDRHLPMLLVITATTLLHELSHATHSFIFGNRSPQCLARDGEPPESGWLLEEKILWAFIGVYFKHNDTSNYSHNFRGIYLVSPDNAEQRYVPGQYAFIDYFTHWIFYFTRRARLPKLVWSSYQGWQPSLGIGGYTYRRNVAAALLLSQTYCYMWKQWRRQSPFSISIPMALHTNFTIYLCLVYSFTWFTTSPSSPSSFQTIMLHWRWAGCTYHSMDEWWHEKSWNPPRWAFPLHPCCWRRLHQSDVHRLKSPSGGHPCRWVQPSVIVNANATPPPDGTL